VFSGPYRRPDRHRQTPNRPAHRGSAMVLLLGAGLHQACSPRGVRASGSARAEKKGQDGITAPEGLSFHPPMALRLPPYQPLPAPAPDQPLHEVAIAQLQPTQLCVGLAEVRSRQRDFSAESRSQRRNYLGSKPVPLVRDSAGSLWMVDRHHRLRALIELDPTAKAFGYIVLQVESHDRADALEALRQRGWLYLYDGRGLGPLAPAALPTSLTGLQDDPYRSLVWKLKKEGVIQPAPLIPFHEFRWGAWLRRRPLPPFSSDRLEPALPAARALARSSAASHLAGWNGLA